MAEVFRIGSPEGCKGMGADVSSLGARILDLSFDGHKVFHPYELFNRADGSTALRGGMHICSPWFGPGPSETDPQHGWARDAVWKLGSVDSSSLVMSLSGGYDGWAHLSQILSYEVNPDEGSFTANLELNKGGELSKQVNPAFHPYFYGLPQEEGWVNGEVDISDFSADGVEIRLQSGLSVLLTGIDTPKIAKWTDSLGEYACYEPISAPTNLEPRQSVTIGMKVQVLN